MMFLHQVMHFEASFPARTSRWNGFYAVVPFLSLKRLGQKPCQADAGVFFDLKKDTGVSHCHIAKLICECSDFVNRLCLDSSKNGPTSFEISVEHDEVEIGGK